MTLTNTEMDRIAAAVHILRPDWPVKSIRTIIRTDLATYDRTAVIVMLGSVAADSESQTPGRVLENGPWKRAAAVYEPGLGQRQPPKPTDDQCEWHPGEYAGHCRSCRAEELAADQGVPTPVTPFRDERRQRSRRASEHAAAARAAMSGRQDA